MDVMDESELGAYERGRRVGQREGMPFAGIPAIRPWLPGAKYDFSRSPFDSFVAYERSVITNLRFLQRMRWLEHSARSDASGNLRVSSEPPATLEELEREIKAELWKVRAAVDCELEEGRGRVCIVEAMRVLPQ